MLIIISFSSSPHNSTKYLINGVYQGLGQLNIVTDSIKAFGYFQSYRTNYSISTVFFLYGKRLKEPDSLIYFITTFYPGEKDTITGKIYVINKRNLFVSLDRVPPGNEFSIDRTKDEFEIVKSKQWKGLGFIKKPQDYMAKSIYDTSKSIGYIIKGDCVALLDCKNGFFKVEYIGKTKNIIGWIPRDDIYLLF